VHADYYNLTFEVANTGGFEQRFIIRSSFKILLGVLRLILGNSSLLAKLLVEEEAIRYF